MGSDSDDPLVDAWFMPAVGPFVSYQMERLGNRQGNVISFVLMNVGEYRSMLLRVLGRYSPLNDRYLKTVDELTQSLGSGSGEFSPAQQELFNRQLELSSALRQEIETFYVFARILLDKITQATRACFGPGKGMTASHRQFMNVFPGYLGARNLSTPANEFMHLMRDFENRIMDFRDDVIVHEKSPRGMKGLGWNNEERLTYLTYNRLFPRPTDSQIDGRPPPELMDQLETYLDLWTGWLVANQDKTSAPSQE